MALRSAHVGRTAAGVTVGVAVGVTVAGIASAALVAALVAPWWVTASSGGTAVTEPEAAGLDGAAPDAAGPGVPGPTGCRCGHDAAAHEHFRPGSDCGACGAARCGRFRAARDGHAWRGLWRAGRAG